MVRNLFSFAKQFSSLTSLPIRKSDCRCFVSNWSPVSAGDTIVSQDKSYCQEFLHGDQSFDVRKSESPQSENLRKILKIAVVGLPNAGKSTLINQIIGRDVFAVSSKVHTTRCRARAVAVVENTQLVFLDTPGIVGVEESIKHHLERPCIIDSEEAIKEADVLLIVHDVSNIHIMFKLDPKILRFLFLYPKKRSYLILNKVDAMKSKRELLECVNQLTRGQGVLNEPDSRVLSKVFQLNEEGRNQLTESDLQYILLDETGWPYFHKIFMVSALHGDGIGDIQMYLLEQAMPGEWMFEKGKITDQNDADIIKKTVFAKLLDNLPNVVPYNIIVQVDYFERNTDGSVTAVVLLYVKKPQIMHLIKGKGGGRIKEIALAVEQSLRSFYLNDVHVRLVIAVKKGIHSKTEK